MNRRRLGAAGESRAAAYLRDRGYRIVSSNFRTPFGEIDLIVEKDGVLIYCEVKYRRGGSCGDPLEAVDVRKQKKICRVASYHYARYAAEETPCRFDVIGVYADGSVRHIKNAFYFQDRN